MQSGELSVAKSSSFTQFNHRTRTLQPTCSPYDYSAVTEDGKLLDGSSRDRVARMRLNSAFVLFGRVFEQFARRFLHLIMML